MNVTKSGVAMMPEAPSPFARARAASKSFGPLTGMIDSTIPNLLAAPSSSVRIWGAGPPDDSNGGCRRYRLSKQLDVLRGETGDDACQTRDVTARMRQRSHEAVGDRIGDQ